MTDPASALQHERHYTVAEANAERAWVAAQVERVRNSIELLSDQQAREAIEAIDPDSGGGYPGHEPAAAVIYLLGALSELDGRDIVLRDAGRGLVDFPALRGEEEIYLCWLVEEDEVSHWHEPDAGFAGRRPID